MVAFFGDSITDAGHRLPDTSPLGEGYVRVIADALSSRPAAPEVVNLGIGGDRVRDLRARWEEVQAAHPDLLTIFIGINDVWRHFDSAQHTTPEAFSSDYRSIMDAAVALDTPVILMEPFLLPVRPDQQQWLPELEEKIAIVNQLGTTYGAPVVHLHRILTDAATDGIAPSELAADGVHPSRLGHRLIAEAWLCDGLNRAGEKIGA
jgi:lysophospholipase L1-like esterase